MKKYLPLAAVIIILAAIIPKTAFADTATVYVSPNASSVKKGEYISVAVKVNSGINEMNAIQATLNYDKNKLQYHSYSQGSFSLPIVSHEAGEFNYAAVVPGSTITATHKAFLIKFKALAVGTSDLTLTDVLVINGVDEFDNISVSNGSITIKEYTESPTKKATEKDDDKKEETISLPDEKEEDTTAPKLLKKPTYQSEKTILSLAFGANEEVRATIQYKALVEEDYKTIAISELRKSHSLNLGDEEPLIPGTQYKIIITLRDKSGNKSEDIKLEAKTLGMTYTVKITDQKGNVLKNHPVTLHSDPINVTTDENGIARFDDVTPGEHTLVFEINGLVMRQPVTINHTDSSDGQAENESIEELVLPITLADNYARPSAITNWILLTVAAIFGGFMALIINRVSKKQPIVLPQVFSRRLSKNNSEADDYK